MPTPEKPTPINSRLLMEPDRTVWVRTDATQAEIQFAKELEAAMALTDAPINDQFVDDVWLSSQEVEPVEEDDDPWVTEEEEEEEEETCEECGCDESECECEDEDVSAWRL